MSYSKDRLKSIGIHLAAFAVAALLGSSRPLHADEAQVEHTLEGYLRWAQVNNPAIAAARAKVAVKERDVRLALSIPDPKVSAGYFISEIETRVGPQKAKIGASQMIPWPGKLAAKRTIARRELDAAREGLRSAEAGVFAEVRGAYASLYRIERETEINKENLALLKHMESILLTKYATATAKQVSLLKLQVEMAVLEDELAGLAADATKAREMLAALLSIDTRESEIPLPTILPALLVPDGLAALKSNALNENSMLGEAKASTAAATATVGLARQSFAPDFMVMTDYMFTDTSPSAMVSPDENGKDPWVVGASVTLPVWVGSKATKVRKARAMEAMKQSAAENITNMVSERSTRLFEDYADAKRRASLYEHTLVPTARQTLAVVEEAYANGGATVLDFLDAQRVLLKLEIALARQHARREMIAGKIDALVGGNLTREVVGNR